MEYEDMPLLGKRHKRKPISAQEKQRRKDIVARRKAVKQLKKKRGRR